MRIAYIIASLKIGGAEVALAQLAPRIKEKGHDVIVAFFHDGPIRARLEAAGITTYQITGLCNRYDPLAWWRLYRWLQVNQVDVLHTSLWSANIIGRIIGHLLNLPVVSDLHGNCQAEGWLRNWGDRLTAGFSAVTIAVSNSVAQAYQKLIIKKQPIKLITIPNAIDTSKIINAPEQASLHRSEFNIPVDAFIVGAVGRLEPIKGYELLIEACALLPANTYLLIIGDGSCRQELEKLARDKGIAERFLITGFRSDAFRFYQLFGCFAIASHSEGLSLALLEAMATGCPVVTTNQTSTHDVLTHGTTGLIITKRSPAAYALLLQTLIDNAAYRHQLGRAAQQLVCQLHDIGNAVNLLDALYLSLKKPN
jgi:glycosyltransferase involved in cell wall biosynthesis